MYFPRMRHYMMVFSFVCSCIPQLIDSLRLTCMCDMFIIYKAQKQPRKQTFKLQMTHLDREGEYGLSIMTVMEKVDRVIMEHVLTTDSVYILHCYVRVNTPYYRLSIYCAIPIYRDHFSRNHSRKTPIARPSGRGMGVLRELEVGTKFYIRSCAVCNIVSYCTAIYRESIILHSYVIWQCA